MLASIAAHEDGISGLTWLTDANEAQICSAGRDQQIKIWDWRLEREVRSWSAHADQIRALSEVPNANGSPRVASCGDDRVVKVWDTGSATEVCTLRGHLDRVLCVTAADGEVYSSGEDRTLRSWRIAPAGELKTFRGSTDVVRSVAAAPDGSWVVSGGDDLLLRIWNTTSETGLATAGHRRRINCVGVLASRDQSSSPLIVSGSDDETVRVWSSGSAEELTSLYGHSGPVNVVGTDPGGRWFCSGGEDGTVRLWSTRQAWSKVKSSEHAGRIVCLLMDPRGQLFYSASEDHTVKIWDRSCSLITTLRGHAEAITSLALTANNLLVSASNDNTLKVWDAGTGNLLRTLGSTFDPSVVSGGMQARGGHTGAVTCLASAGDNLVISGSKDSTVRLWNVDTGQELRKFSGARGVIENLLLTPGGKLVAFGSAPQIATWDLARGGSPELLTGHKSRVSCAATIQTNQLVTGSLDKTVQLWNLDTRESLQSFRGHSDWVTCVAISTDGDELVSGSRDGKVMLWKVKQNTSLTLVGHTESVRGVAIDAVNRRVISYADDQWLLIWDLESGEELNAVHFDSPITSFLMVSPDEFLLGTRRGGVALVKTERSRPSQSFTRQIDNAA
jgi:WD40 repeat protein